MSNADKIDKQMAGTELGAMIDRVRESAERVSAEVVEELSGVLRSSDSGTGPFRNSG